MEERLSVDTEVMVIWPADIWFMLLMLPLEAMGTPLMFGLALLPLYIPLLGCWGTYC
uniref:Uncharacterized protein n=1 Tax=Oncorhynchus kisutch TaxID=8019 RepID=A0A8C7HDJ5_ONCKI